MSKSLCLVNNKIIGIYQLNLPIFLTLFFIFLLLPGDSKCCEKKWRHFFLIFLGQRCNLNLHQIRAKKEKRPRCPHRHREMTENSLITPSFFLGIDCPNQDYRSSCHAPGASALDFVLLWFNHQAVQWEGCV